jgi:ribosome-associated protein
LQPKKIALLAREAAEDKKAEDPLVLDVAKLTSLAHYFIIAHGNSDRHVKAIAQGIIDALDAKDVKLWHREGMEKGHWILLDFGSVIVHVFYKEIREFYGLERLWGDAPRL